MNKIEQSYLDNLVKKTRQGSSNAFAELTAAVYKRHYRYLMLMLGDDSKVIGCLKTIYARILRNVPALSTDSLYMPWTLRLCYRQCEGANDSANMNKKIKTGAGYATLLQLYHLPLTESQVLIMHCKQKISVREIGNILNFDCNVVKRCIKSGLRRLKKNTGISGYETYENIDTAREAAEDGKNDSPEILENSNRRRSEAKKPDVIIIQEILDEVFKECSRKPNSVPVEALAAYAVYRKERFSLQKGVLVAAQIVFLLLPLLFIAPEFELDVTAVGERGLPVVSINVTPRLPVGKVLANVNKHSLPVYEAGAFEYSVEPTRNGTLTIKVELINRQSLTRELEMEDVDSAGPVLAGNSINDDTVSLFVKDDGIGIDYREIYAEDKDGIIYYPLSYNEETGEVVFSYPDVDWDVYIPDHLGNRLHLSFAFE